MKKILARNIRMYRKKRGLTQLELGEKLNITAQAISRWENGKVLPDISFLPILSNCFGISVDQLMGYSFREKKASIYEDVYLKSEYYWGESPSALAIKVLEFKPPVRKMKLLEIGSKEGVDTIFFARNGYDVTAFDISPKGLKKTKTLAELYGVNICLAKGAISEYLLDSYYDIIYCNGALDYLRKESRKEIIENYKKFTKPGGINLMSVNVVKPYIKEPTGGVYETPQWISGELMTYYYDWKFKSMDERINVNEKDKSYSRIINEIIVVKPN